MEEKDLRRGILELWKGSDKISRIKAMGISMEPLIREGAEVIIRHSGAPEFGDIILFDGPDGLVVHRVIGKKIDKGKTYVIEKGDSSSGSTIIPEEKVIGIAIGIEKGGKMIRLNTTFSELTGKALALYSLLSFKVLSRFNLKKPPKYSSLFSLPRKVLIWLLKSYGADKA